MRAQGYIEQLTGEAAGEALSALCALGKTKAGREEINGLLGDRLSLYGAAASEKPKVRKNAYRLMGALEDGRDLPVLREALQKEETLFAVPSLLLALGRLGDEESLRAYEPPASLSPETDGLVAQIVLAKEKALQSFESYGAEQIDRLPAPHKVLCYAPEGFLDMLMEELRELGLDPRPESGAAAVTTDRIDLVYRADCMTEALLPVGQDCRGRTTPRPTTRSCGWTAVSTGRTYIGSFGTWRTAATPGGSGPSAPPSTRPRHRVSPATP